MVSAPSSQLFQTKRWRLAVMAPSTVLIAALVATASSAADPLIRLVVIEPATDETPRSDTASVAELAHRRLMVVYHKYDAGKHAGHDHGLRRIWSKVSAEVVEPVPIVLLAILPERTHRRRTDPQVIVESGGRLGRLRVPDVSPPLAVPGFGNQHVPDNAFGQQLHCLADGRRAPALRANLDHAFRAERRLDHEPPFANVVRAGLFDIDMFPGLAGENGGGYARGEGYAGRGNAEDRGGWRRGGPEKQPAPLEETPSRQK